MRDINYDEVLMNYAKEVMKNAYAPYSNFKVGAALLTNKGTVYTGCNVENSSYGATVCAERNAIFQAVANGEQEFVKIAICCSENRFPIPCGMCLQVMQEFNDEIEIILSDHTSIKKYKLEDFLPVHFKL
ncbi:MAG: cytidine deaminase [Lachnospiraceae bacterium]|nr:cytidine deaminase [Lachnospiraceae bacterium]